MRTLCFVARSLVSGSIVSLLMLPALAQKPGKDNQSGYDRSAKATLVHPADVYAAPDGDSMKAALVNPGHEVVIAERSGPWVRVFANTDVKDTVDDRDEPEFSDDDPTPASGWIRDKGIVTPATPHVDVILYGAAANLEAAAAEPHAPKDAASEAHLLYRRAATYFPQSPLAAEAAWRSADIRWQIDKRDQSTLPSAKEQDASLRPALFDGELKRVMKLFPNTPQAAKAAYDLIANKLCGDWQGLPKCPELESSLYEKYAAQYPGGPMSAEALYEATIRQGTLVTMYDVEENHKRSVAAAARTQALAQQMREKYPQSDYTPRAESIAYRVAQGIAVYGNDRD
jgi:hypothetical protein